MELYGIVYKITNLINGHSYIGQTTYSLRVRWGSHLSQSRTNPKKHCVYLYNALNKYGFENFKIEEICSCFNKEELDKQEEYFIKYYNTLDPNGYNLKEGGSFGKHSKTTCQKKSKSQKQAYKNDQTLLDRRTKGFKEFWTNPNPVKLQERSNKLKQSWTSEKRQKYSELHKCNKHAIGNSSASKPIIATNIHTNETKEYESSAELCKFLNVSPSLISRLLSDSPNRKTAKGWVVSFKYDNNHENKVIQAQSNKALMRGTWSTKIKCIHVESKQEYTFNTAQEAVKALNLFASEISTRLSGKRTGLHKGYRILPII